MVNSGASIVILVAILALVNFLAERRTLRLDLTSNQQYSLAPQTLSVLREIHDQVSIKVFETAENRNPGLEDLIQEYSKRGPITYTFVNLDRQPDEARRYNVRAAGTIVLEQGGRTEQVDTPVEEALTNALSRLVRQVQPVLYFTQGHGERPLDGPDGSGLKALSEQLTAKGFKTQSLATSPEVPADAAAVVIAGPQSEFFSAELEALDRFLNQGGAVLALLDPPPSAGLPDFLARHGLVVGDNLVVDASSIGQLLGLGPAVPLVTSYPGHSITEGFSLMTFFPLARSVMPASPAPQGVTLTKLLSTGSDSWGETDLASPQVQFDQGVDLAGPVSLAVVSSWTAPGASPGPEEGAASFHQARLVAFGDSDFVSNRYFNSQGNGDLALNTISWLARQEDLIAIRPKDPQDRRVALTLVQARTIFISTVIVLPALALGLMVWNMLRRRAL
ncbi:MAG: GldG family protein [Deinococcus sp.]|nr:GldG family protein [Deinococcus sp.]